MISSSGFPCSRARVVTSARFTDDRKAPGRSGTTFSAPFSAKITASTAEASKTRLFVIFPPGFFAALANQFIDNAHAGDAIRGEGCLNVADELLVRDEVQTVVSHFDRKRIALAQSDLLASFGRNGDT